MNTITTTSPSPSTLKLTFCIATYNRAPFLRTTIEGLISQMTGTCEILVCDNSSTDDTEQVVSDFSKRSSSIRYIKQATNVGLDRNFDDAVRYAHGEYCWLMSDDDLLKQGAVAEVLNALHRDPDLSLVVVNTEYRSLNMSKIVQPRALDFNSDRVYGPGETDRLFREAGSLLPFIGCLIIRRAIWLTRERERYFNSLWIHVGVLFQDHLPGRTLVIAQPFISYRCGNRHAAEISPYFSLLTVKWPSVLQSLVISDPVKRQIYRTDFWPSLTRLLWCRAVGSYSINEYQRLIRPRSESLMDRLLPAAIAVLPGTIINTAFVLYYLLRSPKRHGLSLQLMSESRFHLHFRIFGREPS